MIKLILLDVDGTLTDGGIYLGNSGEELKKFNVKDGYAILNAQKLGIEFGIITGAESELLKKRAEKLNIKYKVLSIEGILNAFYETIDINLSNLRKGNLAARVRMSLLYDYSSSINALVIGTSNKSELMLGYGTIFGDLACAINPIGELYKSEIFEFAKHLGVDKNFIDKAPSADLWDGQSDEGDIGYSYAVIDEILENLENNKEQVIKKFGLKAVSDIENRVVSNRFKRQMPLIVKI